MHQKYHTATAHISLLEFEYVTACYKMDAC